VAFREPLGEVVLNMSGVLNSKELSIVGKMKYNLIFEIM
jgi:hypothetical protein